MSESSGASPVLMTIPSPQIRVLLLGAALLLPAALSVAARSPELEEQPPAAAAPAHLPGLERITRLSPRLYVGSTPEGEAGFRSLAQLGIKTVLTVDGAAPEVERAEKHGLRYVHLPIGYDGCPTPRAHQIARAVRDLPGPIYLHCHHGRHRAPTAAAFARIALDGLSPEQAVAEMERLGTGKEYVGLYADVRAFRPPTPVELDAVPATWRAVEPAAPLAASMVEIERRFDRLLTLQREGWKAPVKDAEHEALQLRELYVEWARTAEARGKPRELLEWTRAAETDARTLQEALRGGLTARASESLGRLAVGCGGCHGKYRNVPQPAPAFGTGR